MTAAHRTLPFGTVLMVQSGGRSIQVTVNDRGPFTGAFLDLSPAAASALGCRCTHRNVTATVVQMGSGGTVVVSRGRQRPVAVAAMPLFFQPTEDAMRPLAMYGSTMAMAPAPRHYLATALATRTDPSSICRRPHERDQRDARITRVSSTIAPGRDPRFHLNGATLVTPSVRFPAPDCLTTRNEQ